MSYVQLNDFEKTRIGMLPSKCPEIKRDLSAVGDVSEGEADVAEVLLVRLVALHILPLVHRLSQVHHRQRDFNLDKQKPLFHWQQSIYIIEDLSWQIDCRYLCVADRRKLYQPWIDWQRERERQGGRECEKQVFHEKRENDW